MKNSSKRKRQREAAQQRERRKIRKALQADGECRVCGIPTSRLWLTLCQKHHAAKLVDDERRRMAMANVETQLLQRTTSEPTRHSDAVYFAARSIAQTSRNVKPDLDNAMNGSN